MNIEIDPKALQWIKKNGGAVTVKPPRPAVG
jgi:hypothetical protein